MLAQKGAVTNAAFIFKRRAKRLTPDLRVVLKPRGTLGWGWERKALTREGTGPEYLRSARRTGSSSGGSGIGPGGGSIRFARHRGAIRPRLGSGSGRPSSLTASPAKMDGER